jgi:hypothetical protein
MKPFSHYATLILFLLSTDARALGNIADIQIIDRDSGAVLDTHSFRGEYWVAGRPGARYSIRVRNDSGGRILAVTSVDGINVLSGASAGWTQQGYVFRPGEAYEISGWRKSQAEVAAFTFTDPADSYAGRTGRPANVGVIGVALFRERSRSPAVGGVPFVTPAPALAGAGGATRSDSVTSAGPMGGRLADAPLQPAPAAVIGQYRTPGLGTGHGERQSSYVEFVDFERLQTQPNEIVRIRYDRLENLVAMGVIRPTDARPPLPDPFPGTRHRFVPDPPG